MVVNALDPDSLVDEATKMVSMKLSTEAGDTLLAVPPADRTGLLVVIGIGLGLHIPDLIRTVSPRHVVLVEPIEEFAVHSMQALDWVSLVQDCKA